MESSGADLLLAWTVFVSVSSRPADDNEVCLEAMGRWSGNTSFSFRVGTDPEFCTWLNIFKS